MKKITERVICYIVIQCLEHIKNLITTFEITTDSSNYSTKNKFSYLSQQVLHYVLKNLNSAVLFST